jgi:hypothetical protein
VMSPAARLPGSRRTPAESQRPAVVSAPDLLEPVVGFRAWRIIEDRLYSPYIPVRWPERVHHARCYPANRALLFGHGWLEEPHSSPHPACKCGIYAEHQPVTDRYFGEFDWAAGIVTVWGRVEVHADGLRAEHAEVQALGIKPGWSARRADGVRRVAAALGVPTVLESDLAAVAGELGAPIPPSLLPRAA